MPDTNKLNLRDDLLLALKKLKEASISELTQSLSSPASRRTVQRHLVTLLQEGLINQISDGPHRRYKIKQASSNATKSNDILAYIKKPLIERNPVGYQRSFVDGYTPNKTFYLPETIRKHLAEISNGTVAHEIAGTFARQIYQRLLIDLSWNSSRLEGNTYSLLETQKLLEHGKSSEGKDSQETQMILNHKNALAFLIDSADQIGFNRYTILNLHALLSENLLGDPSACGQLRKSPVGIGKTAYHPPEIPQLIDEMFQKILNIASAIHDPFEQSFFVMVQLPYLQPFIDVNKRVSRLSANIPFIKNNLCPLSFIDVTKEAYIDGILGVYELNRIELFRDVYVSAYERSCKQYSVMSQTIGEPNLFRMQYRDVIAQTIHHVITQHLDQQQALAFTRTQSQTLPKDKRAHFVEIVETELLYLQEGNIARYHISLKEFERWQRKK